jgi:6-phosphofructokinase 1
MVSIKRGSGQNYSWSLGEASLSEVATMEKNMPRSCMTKDGFGITKIARDYLEPLIEGEDPPPYKNGLPDYVSLKKIMVPKKLTEAFKI